MDAATMDGTPSQFNRFRRALSLSLSLSLLLLLHPIPLENKLEHHLLHLRALAKDQVFLWDHESV